MLVRKAEEVAQRISFWRKVRGEDVRNNGAENDGCNEGGAVRCPHCGDGKMKLIRIWSKQRGFIYDATKACASLVWEGAAGEGNVVEDKKDARIFGRLDSEQLAFGFLISPA